jgi:tripartite-type tricarboxylate transporter receptor subunit TctC
VAESGFKDYDVTLWYALIGPKGLSPEIVSRINAEVNKALAQKETVAKLELDGASPAGGTPVQLQAVIRKEIDLWRRIVTKLGVKPE